MKLLLVCLCLILVILPELVLTQSSCSTPSGTSGFCVTTNECQYVKDIQLSYGRNIPRYIQSQLRAMQCYGPNRRSFYLCCPHDSVIVPQSLSSGDQGSTRKTVRATPSQTDLTRIDQRGLQYLNAVTECGKKSNPKLSGGMDTKPGEFPWLALLKYETQGRPFLCGGSLISDRFVLTAAHCVVQSAKLIGVRLGEHDLSKEEDCQLLGGRTTVCLPPYEEYGIEAIRPHPSYVHGSINHDIALIKLDRTVKEKVHIKPVCLPIESNSQNMAFDQDFFIAGWGQTEFKEPASVLQKVVVNRKSLDVCRNYFRNAPLTNNHICAAGEGLLHTCQGDSGGPLFFLNRFKKYRRFIQYGIVSYGGQRCGTNENKPGVFTNIIEMLPWITQNLD